MSKIERQRPVSVALTDVALHNEFEKERERERELYPNRVSAFPQGIKPKEAAPVAPAPSIQRSDSSLHRGIRVKAISSSHSNSFSSTNVPNELQPSLSHITNLRESSPADLCVGLPPSSEGGFRPSNEIAVSQEEAFLTSSTEITLQKGQKPQLNKIRGGKTGVKRRRSILPHLDTPDGVPQCASSPSIFVSQQEQHSDPPSSSCLVQVQVQVHMTTKSEYHDNDLVMSASMPTVTSVHSSNPSSSASSSTPSAHPKVLPSSVSTCDLQNMRLKKLPLWDVRRTPGIPESLTAGRVSEGSGGSAGSSHSSEMTSMHLAGYQLMTFPENLPDIDRDTAMISHLHPMQYFERMTSSTDEAFLFTFMRRHDLSFDSKREEFAALTQSLSRLCIDRLPPNDRVPKASLVIHGGRSTGIPFVKSGTTNSLFRMLCDDVTRGANPFSFLEASLLLTYPLFSSTELVLSTFGYIIEAHLHNKKSAKELKSVGDALYHWVGLIPEDFEGAEGSNSLKKLNYLLSQCHSSPVVPLSFMDRNRQFIQRVRSVANAPIPILPMNLHGGFQSLSLMVLDPIEVARQMALRSFRTFELISPREWLNTKHVDTDHISTLSKEFNYLANFFAEAILESADVNVRADVICRCVRVAEESLKLRNFHTFMAILCSLNCAAISRLQRTWKVVKKNKEIYGKYTDLEALGEMENNFQNLREVCVVTPDIPSIPYLGLYLSDITFIIDGNRFVG